MTKQSETDPSQERHIVLSQRSGALLLDPFSSAAVVMLSEPLLYFGQFLVQASNLSDVNLCNIKLLLAGFIQNIKTSIN